MAETVLNQQEQKLDPSADGKEQKVRLKRIVGLMLSVVMVGLTVYVLNLQNHNSRTLADSTDMVLTSSSQQAANYRSYVRQYKETKIQLEETTRKLEEVNRQLDAVTAELSLTKGMLGETKTMLGQVQAENADLKKEIAALETQKENVPQLEAKVTTLKEKNVQVSSELDDLKVQMRAFEADFSNMEEGKSLITLFRNKIALVKARMRYLKQEAYFAKVAAQKERDRVEVMNGNSGYLVRGGQVKAAGKPFAIDVKIMQ